jgi:hypothetical protein
MKITRNLPFVILMAIIIQAFTLTETAAQTNAPAYMQLTDEQKEKLNDALDLSKSMVTESQEKLTEMLNHWGILKDNFHRLPPQLQNAINKIEGDGFTAKVNYTLGKLKQFEGGLKEVTDVRDDLESAINLYNRYAPDDQNPFRSLEVLSNLFTDVEKLLPEEQEYEAIKSPITFMIRTGIVYFREGIDAALGGLRNIQKQIRDRSANCIGFVGGDATADSSDPKRKAFTDLNTGEEICYTGVRPIGGEIWSNTSGDAAFIWSSGKWTRLQEGFGLASSIFSDWKLAYESVITADDMIRWCNNRMLYYEARSQGEKEFARLSARDNCRDRLLEFRNRDNDWMNLMESVNTDRKTFVARYIFDIGGIREATRTLTGTMYDNVLFTGTVEDEDRNRIQTASVTIRTPSDARSDMTTGGRFTIMMETGQAGWNGTPIEISVVAAGFPEFRETSRIYTQCMDLGVLRIRKDQPAVSQDCGPNEVYDPVREECTCINGYVRNAQGICVEEDQTGEAPECNDPNEELAWNDALGVYVCNCRAGFVRDPLTGRCNPDIQQILNNSDCSAYPNTRPVWDNDRSEVYCDCLPGYSWKPDYSGCEETGKLLASQADCSGYPNTQPVWDDVNKVVICDCLPGYVWDENFTQCYPQSVAQMNSINCDGLPNTMPVWDPVRQEPWCDCLPGYKWRDDFSGCDQITATQIVHADCSHLPNTQQVYDPVNDIMVCDCMPGFVWNNSYTGCVPEKKKPAIDMNTLMNFMTILSGAMNNNMPGAMPSTSLPANQQPPVVHQSRCNDTQKAGGDAPEVHVIDLGMTSGVFRFDYQTFSVKDQIIISQGGMTIFNSGCVGESRSVQVQFGGYTSVIEVRVNPNCSGSTNTAWNFTVHCPGR